MRITDSGAGTPANLSGGAGWRAMWQCTHPSDRRRRRAIAGEHLVEGDAQGVEVAAGIDRPVHPAGLFGGHVGERPGDHLRRRRERRSRGRREAMPKPMSQARPVT